MGFYTKKLIKRLHNDLDITVPEGVKIKKCSPGWSTLSAGGFKWTFWSYEHPEWNNVGSQYTVRECAMANKLCVRMNDGYDIFIEVNNS